MEHAPWMFWLVPLLIFLLLRRRRWDGWGPRGPRGGWRGDWRDAPREDETTLALRRELDEQRDYAQSLEERLGLLEERLDFTERLLVERRETPLPR